MPVHESTATDRAEQAAEALAAVNDAAPDQPLTEISDGYRARLGRLAAETAAQLADPDGRPATDSDGIRAAVAHLIRGVIELTQLYVQPHRLIEAAAAVHEHRQDAALQLAELETRGVERAAFMLAAALDAAAAYRINVPQLIRDAVDQEHEGA